MSIHIAAKEIKTVRKNYDYTSRRFGDKKTASRYQEAAYDIQPTTNFHYPPTWEEDKELYDVSRTAIVMEDWYAFADPRQYYYTSYVTARAKQQESMSSNLDMAEKRGLLNSVPADLKLKVRNILTPFRHVEYGANMNNQSICEKGYGTTITSLASFNGFDRVGIAQYISRIALLIDENEEEGLVKARKDWLENPVWQPLRHAVEDTFVLSDWMETMVAQNVVMDGLVYPLIYDRFINDVVANGGSVFAATTQFMNDWYAETVRWTNQLMKVTAAESNENAELLSSWVTKWSDRLEEALMPIAKEALGDSGADQLAEVKQALHARLAKQGLSV